MMTHAEAVLGLLTQGLDDWVPLHDVVWHARQVAGSDGDLAETVRSITVVLVERDLMRPGDLDESGVLPWDGEPDAIARRVVAECERLGWQPRGDGCWFANTTTGDEQARRRIG